ncbi:MAG: radical SAM protein, partial [Pyrinomonadaceae bacterium]
HKRLYEAGIAMDEDLNKYDLNHDVTEHAIMSRSEWRDVYLQAWQTYYTPEHVETVLRRCIATGTSPGKTMFFIVWFKGCIGIEGIHPLEGGFVRIKVRKNRRPGMKLESPTVFYPKYYAEMLWKQLKWISLYLRMRLIYRRVRKDPKKLEYMDLAIEPMTDHEEERELFQSPAARKFVEKTHLNQKLTHGENV